MKIDGRFRSYYHSVYDAVRLLHKRIFDFSSEVIVESERKWSSKLEIALEEERGALERCEAEIVVSRSRVAWLEQVEGDDLGDRYLWRKGLEALPSWKSKSARHAAKRKAVKSNLENKPKKSKIKVGPQVNAAPDQRSARLVNYSDDEDTTRRVVYTSNNELKDISVEGSGLTSATPELDSAMGVGSQIYPS